MANVYVNRFHGLLQLRLSIKARQDSAVTRLCEQLAVVLAEIDARLPVYIMLVVDMSEYALEDILDQDSANIFSDPESEWTGTFKVEEPEDEQYLIENGDHRPESDQPGRKCEKTLMGCKVTYGEVNTWFFVWELIKHNCRRA
ncbi:hypothetical protein NQ317_001421 [Molorchus minor]|uniref:Uncharacterized protein n=1 Tax=Molorchus minor TaxID=1323400 RepID=A0ABQ9JX99_9CUCU|nr:hypothetical protein NQ317_001421 [Molorchus minor]